MKNHKRTEDERPASTIYANREVIRRKVKALFLSGGQYTASEINRICGGNDARKYISQLRNQELMNICDLRLKNGCKLYWYEPKEREGVANG